MQEVTHPTITVQGLNLRNTRKKRTLSVPRPCGMLVLGWLTSSPSWISQSWNSIAEYRVADAMSHWFREGVDECKVKIPKGRSQNDIFDASSHRVLHTRILRLSVDVKGRNVRAVFHS